MATLSGIQDHLDEIAVIGGGIVGVTLAYRLARSGRHVCLIDPHEPMDAASFGNAGHIATDHIAPMASIATLRYMLRTIVDGTAEQPKPISFKLGYFPHILPWLTRFVWASRPSVFERGRSALAELQKTSLTAWLDLIALLPDDLAAEVRLDTSGHLELYGNPRAYSQAVRALPALSGYGVRAYPFLPEQLAALQASINAPLSGAIRYEGTGLVSDPARLVQIFRQAATRLGVSHISARVECLWRESQGGYCLKLLSTADPVGTLVRLRTEQIVIAAGIGSAPIMRSLGCPVPLEAERGYQLTIPEWWPLDPNGNRLPPMAYEERRVFLAPLDCGTRITGFVEMAGTQRDPDPAKYEALKQTLLTLWPDAPVGRAEKWMGFRPSLPDHLPMVGPVKNRPNVFAAFGHQHLGLTLAAITADTIDRLIEGRKPLVSLAGLGADRFHQKTQWRGVRL